MKVQKGDPAVLSFFKARKCVEFGTKTPLRTIRKSTSLKELIQPYPHHSTRSTLHLLRFYSRLSVVFHREVCVMSGAEPVRVKKGDERYYRPVLARFIYRGEHCSDDTIPWRFIILWYPKPCLPGAEEALLQALSAWSFRIWSKRSGE